MEGEELQFSDAPSRSPPMDTDHEVGDESEEPVGSKEGEDGQTSPGKGAEANSALTNTSTLETGNPLWKNQRGITGVTHGANATAGACSCHAGMWHGHS